MKTSCLNSEMGNIESQLPTIRLCIEGTQAEYGGRMEDARTLYLQAWQAAEDDYSACIAAHYMARIQENSKEILHWNQEALRRAEKSEDNRVKSFFPSLFLNLGHSYELLENFPEAQHYFDLAASLGFPHQADS